MNDDPKVLVAIVVALALAGWGYYEIPRYQVRQQVKAQLIDPGSAEFRNLQKRGTDWCGEVNSRNRLGGYVGWTGFDTSGRQVFIGPMWGC